MKTIAIVATGGTIAGTGKQGKTVAYRAGEMNVDEIIQSIPMIKDIAHIKEYQLMNVDSNEMNPQRWIVLANTINEIVKDETIDGVVEMCIRDRNNRYREKKDFLMKRIFNQL